jgi:FMN phosphatase YigB (HAD superfamily)
MLKQAVLLDFDGVVLRRHPAHDVVALRCQQFAQRHLRIKNPIKAREVNTCLYKTYGHSLLGLQKLGHSVTADEFNHFVYDMLPYEVMFKDVRETNKKDVSDLKDLAAFCDASDVDMFIFSNAPTVWCETILFHMGVAPIPMLTHSHLKPLQACFKEVKWALPEYSRLVFVDDSFINFKHVLEDEHWISVLFSNEVQECSVRIAHNAHMIHDLKHVKHILVAHGGASNGSGCAPSSSERELFSQV